MKLPLAATCLLLATTVAARVAHAETTLCTTIAALPAVLTSQGVYCLKNDLATTMASGAAVTIAANNITIDCNGYKLGGLAAGPSTQAKGIVATARLNAVIRGCNVRGFRHGMVLTGGGHLLHDNRLDGNVETGIVVEGEGIVVRDNSVLDTGGAALNDMHVAFGILAGTGEIDILGNLVSNVGTPGANGAVGIRSGAWAGSISRNRVRGVVEGVGNTPTGILVQTAGAQSLRDNEITGDTSGRPAGCTPDRVVATGNHALRYFEGLDGCVDGGDNVVMP